MYSFLTWASILTPTVPPRSRKWQGCFGEESSQNETDIWDERHKNHPWDAGEIGQTVGPQNRDEGKKTEKKTEAMGFCQMSH